MASGGTAAGGSKWSVAALCRATAYRKGKLRKRVLLGLVLAASVSVDVAAERHPISPLIYGASGTNVQLQRMGATLRRFGGNRVSRYNYLTRTTNLGGDGLFFRNAAVDAG